MPRLLPPLTLAALTAALTLAPAHALAVDDNPGTGECSAVTGSGAVFWDPVTNQFCAADSGFGGGGGGADGSFGIGPGGGGGSATTEEEEILGEPIYVEGKLPTRQPTKSPNRLILVPGRGGGGWGKPDESSDGPGRAGPRPGGQVTVGEVPKAKDKLTKDLCKKLGRKGALLPSVSQKLEELDQQLKALVKEDNAILDKATFFTKRLRGLQDAQWYVRQWKFVEAQPYNIVGGLINVRGIVEGIVDAEDGLAKAAAERQASIEKLTTKRQEIARAEDAGESETRAALRQCGAMYGGA